MRRGIAEFYRISDGCASWYNFAQRRPRVSKKRTTSSSQTTDPRLTVPTPRTFNHSYEIKTTFNKFEDFTKVVLDMGYGKDRYVHGYIFFSFRYSGSTITASPQSITFQYQETAISYKGNTSTMIVLADNDKFVINSYHCSYERGDKICLFDVPYKKFLIIANSSKVEMQVGDDQFEITEEEQEALKDLASRTVRR